MTEAPLVAVGEVLRPFGLRGELKVRPLTDRPRERFEWLDRCVLWEPRADQREDCRIASCRFEGETIWLTQAQMAELFQTTPQNITPPPERHRRGG